MPNEITAISEQAEVTKELLLDYLKQTNSNLLPNEQAQFVAISSAFGLNPWKREIYAVAYGKDDKRKLSIIVGYETYLRRADSFPQYDGYETAITKEDGTMVCTCKVFRKDRNHPTISKVYLNEYHQGNTMWNTKPRTMLEKVAICTALRRAFPSEMGGFPYAEDELPDNMTGADKLREQGHTVINTEKESASPAPSLTPFEEFKADLKDMHDSNPDAYELVKEKMKNEGWYRPSEVPPELYKEIKDWFNLAKIKSADPALAGEQEDVKSSI